MVIRCVITLLAVSCASRWIRAKGGGRRSYKKLAASVRLAPTTPPSPKGKPELYMPTFWRVCTKIPTQMAVVMATMRMPPDWPKDSA